MILTINKPDSALRLIVMSLIFCFVLSGCNSKDDDSKNTGFSNIDANEALSYTSKRNSENKTSAAPLHHTDSGFQNPHLGPIDKSLFKFLRVRFFGDIEWADHAALAKTIPIQPFKRFADTPRNDEIEVTWLGHSTFIIRVGKAVVITDPIFSDRASPVSFAGPKRYIPHVIDYEKIHEFLPNIDAVVISHNHYDHLDEKSINLLGNKPYYAVPLGLGKWFENEGIIGEKVSELDWWQDIQLTSNDAKQRNIRLTALPSQHWSARGLFDRNKTLWASWLIEINGKRIWFAGDTGYNNQDFKQIGEAFDIDMALIPIGAYEPRSFMKAQHVNPAEAVQIHQDIKAKYSIGMHWGTFGLTAEAPIRPVEDLSEALKAANLSSDVFTTMKVGQTLRIRR